MKEVYSLETGLMNILLTRGWTDVKHSFLRSETWCALHSNDTTRTLTLTLLNLILKFQTSH